MRNPACPGLLDLVTPDTEAIQLYRLYVLYRLPLLEFLDSTNVTQEVSSLHFTSKFVILYFIPNHFK